MRTWVRWVAAFCVVLVLLVSLAAAVARWSTPPSCVDVDVLDTGACVFELGETGVHVDELRREWR